ncbi:MotA/TolQ/ExbB proton channel family protein [Pararhodobacter marinus]|uniref:MotA/TolQ/ExbB proton channel family protein n=1 Tax=Pararhodobacter marinus TaxID=2184063 RepID=A0A2U2C9V6_9RHOB|nr:MotA/TolQ/ExbB proton channel family protein [Pararhodobacter marinus]PWE28666.1 MotA/TolQ/ExbB proton channel family protein [Pararhodobacter marinus]
MTPLLEALGRVADLGGPVVMILIAMSAIALALILAKLWQFLRLGVGRHDRLDTALTAWDRGDTALARDGAAQAPSHLAALAVAALSAAETRRDDTALRARLTSLAAERLARLGAGLRLLDSVAQVAPLLGLFGTVLGMIEAFQGLQAAGAAVDPSALAGGIWVALLTTAVGLAVAMPASLVLTWFDARIAREARMAERIIDTALCAGVGNDD